MRNDFLLFLIKGLKHFTFSVFKLQVVHNVVVNAVVQYFACYCVVHGVFN